MYLSQVFSAKNKWAYSVVCIFMLLLFYIPIISHLSSESEDKQKYITEMIQKLGELPTYAILLSTSAFFLFPLFSIVLLTHHQNLTQFTTGRKKVDFKRILFSFLIFGGINTLSFLINYLISPESYAWNFQFIPFILLLLISILLLPFQIGFEEYFFRGYLMQWLGLLSKNKWIPLFLSSILFGLAHISNPEVEELGYEIMPFYIGMGFILGIITLIDDGLELALGIHFSNNLFIALLSTSNWSIFQTPSLFKETDSSDINSFTILWEILTYILVLYIFAKKYHWTNWKEKLLGKLQKS